MSSSRRAQSPEAGRPQARRPTAREVAVRRRRLGWGLLVVLAVVVLAALLPGAATRARSTHVVSTRGPGSVARGPGSAAPRPGSAGSALTGAGARTRRRPARRARRAASSPGSLAQTHAYPSTASARFKALMADLWRGIQRDSLDAAMPAFFPRAAYVRLKAVSDAAADWSARLVHEYHLDIAAAHALLGRDAASSRLLGVEVHSSYGHWVPPGACYNDVGYFELPNARILYSQNGATRSLGIASMISWRGVWYVVHLGAVLRGEDVGLVDQPSAGAGRSIYSGTC